MERLKKGDPDQIGPWQLINRLGSGGMGIVYLGTNGTRSAAIKVVRDFLLEDVNYKARLNREVATLKKVKSKFVAEIIDSDVESIPAWIATNYVDGPSLKTAIENEGKLTEADWIEFAVGIISALEAVHKLGVIHRDIKPNNILLSNYGPKLIDFGISFSNDATSLTKTGILTGTSAWFAPEQFLDQTLTTAVDIFAAGSILYFAATGKIPWGKEDASVAQVMNRILNDEPEWSSLSSDQAKLIKELIHKDPKKRLNATNALILLKSLQNISSSSSTGNNEKKFYQLNTKIGKAFWALISVSSILVFILLIYFPSQSNQENYAEKTEKSLTWLVNIEGDDNPVKGMNENVVFYICDQSVIEKSLQIKELTNPPLKTPLKAIVLAKDLRCGKDFDTIEISGILDIKKSLREYIIGGATQVGTVIQYKFEIEVKNK